MKCSCGAPARHAVALRRTADGVRVNLWSDGAVTGALGVALPGVPVARPRGAAAIARALAAGWMLLGEVELYDADEVPTLFAACRWAASRGLPVADARRRFVELRAPRVSPVWTVRMADRDGKPTEREWILPRLRWPGLAVLDYCNKAERYELVNVERGGVCFPTGIRFATLRALAEHLASIVVERSGRATTTPSKAKDDDLPENGRPAGDWSDCGPDAEDCDYREARPPSATGEWVRLIPA